MILCLGGEKLHNVFMRSDLAKMQQLRNTKDGVETMRSLRDAKDVWKPQ